MFIVEGLRIYETLASAEWFIAFRAVTHRKVGPCHPSRGLIMTHTPGLAFANRLKSICQRGHYSRLARREYLSSPVAAKYKWRKASRGILFSVFADRAVVAETACRSSMTSLREHLFSNGAFQMFESFNFSLRLFPSITLLFFQLSLLTFLKRLTQSEFSLFFRDVIF